jgi:hypothetical protein
VLNPIESQIEVSAGLLHSFGEVISYMRKLERNTEAVALKANLTNNINFLEQLQKVEMINLKNWCGEL